MLPRSLFSASTLKYGQSSEDRSGSWRVGLASNGVEKDWHGMTIVDIESHSNSSRAPYTRRSNIDDPVHTRLEGSSAKSPLTIDSENEQYFSGESASLVGSSDDEDNSTPSNLQGLMHHVIHCLSFIVYCTGMKYWLVFYQLSRLQAKQRLYIEKTQEISRQMQDTSAKIAELTGMSLHHRPSSSSSSSSKYLRTE